MEDRVPAPGANGLQAGATQPSQTSEARADMAQDQEAAISFADVVIFCHPRNVRNLVQSFETEIKHAARALPTFVLWSGTSAMLHQGVIVLEWEGAIPMTFFRALPTTMKFSIMSSMTG